MKYILILLLIPILSFNACTSDEESKRQVNSSFQGEWLGTFSGDDSGSLSFIIGKEGMMTGEIIFTPSNTKEIIEGYVNFDGKFDMNTKSNYSFSGILNNSKPVIGQWKKTAPNWTASGNFTINKK